MGRNWSTQLKKEPLKALMKWQWSALEGAKNGREPKREKISRYVTLFSATIEVKTLKWMLQIIFR